MKGLCATGVRVGLADGCVNKDVFEVRFRDQRSENSVPDAGTGPTPEPAMRGLPVAGFGRQVAPWRCRARQPQDRVHEKPIVGPGTTPVSCLPGQAEEHTGARAPFKNIGGLIQPTDAGQTALGRKL